jgi:hypothetical protein
MFPAREWGEDCKCVKKKMRNAWNIILQKGEKNEALGIFSFKLEKTFMKYI